MSWGLAGTARLPPLESDRSVSAALLQIRGQGDDAAHHGMPNRAEAGDRAGGFWITVVGDVDTVKPVAGFRRAMDGPAPEVLEHTMGVVRESRGRHFGVLGEIVRSPVPLSWLWNECVVVHTAAPQVVKVLVAVVHFSQNGA